MNLSDREPVSSLPEPSERIRLRLLFGATQADIASEIGVTRQMVNRWERGHSEPSGENRTRYAALLAAWAAREIAIATEIKKAGDSLQVGQVTPATLERILATAHAPERR